MLDSLDAFWETTDPEIIEARKVFSDLYAKYKVKTDEDAKKVREVGGLFYRRYGKTRVKTYR